MGSGVSGASRMRAQLLLRAGGNGWHRGQMALGCIVHLRELLDFLRRKSIVLCQMRNFGPHVTFQTPAESLQPTFFAEPRCNPYCRRLVLPRFENVGYARVLWG